MTTLPETGGSYARDPETGALVPTASEADPPEAVTPPEPVQTKKGGK